MALLKLSSRCEDNYKVCCIAFRLCLTITRSIITTYISHDNLPSNQSHFLSQLLITVIGCLQLSAHHQLSIGKTVSIKLVSAGYDIHKVT